MTRKIFAEFLGTALLLVSVIGSGIAGASLSDGNTAIALLANAIATGCMLYVIITCLGPISGAHFNPGVTLLFWLRGQVPMTTALTFVVAQVAGGILGVWLTHGMYGLDILQFSQKVRSGPNLWLSEFFATFGLLFVILGGLRFSAHSVPMLVAIYITGAYWFTSSTSFANPAVTIARMFSDTFAGIFPGHIAAFIAMQILAVLVGNKVLGWLFADD